MSERPPIRILQFRPARNCDALAFTQRLAIGLKEQDLR